MHANPPLHHTHHPSSCTPPPVTHCTSPPPPPPPPELLHPSCILLSHPANPSHQSFRPHSCSSPRSQHSVPPATRVNTVPRSHPTLSGLAPHGVTALQAGRLSLSLARSNRQARSTPTAQTQVFMWGRAGGVCRAAQRQRKVTPMTMRRIGARRPATRGVRAGG